MINPHPNPLPEGEGFDSPLPPREGVRGWVDLIETRRVCESRIAQITGLTHTLALSLKGEGNARLRRRSDPWVSVHPVTSGLLSRRTDASVLVEVSVVIWMATVTDSIMPVASVSFVASVVSVP